MINIQQPPRRDKVSSVATPSIKQTQLWATSLLIGLPAIGTALTVVWSLFYPPGTLEIGALVVMWAWTFGFGTSVGYHRYFTHRAFQASAHSRVLMAVAGAMAFQGPVLYWVAIHRKHHESSDQPGDPHSPRPDDSGLWPLLKSMWHGHIGWMSSHEIPNPIRYAPDLLKDRVVMWVNRHYLIFAVAGLVLPAVVCGLIAESWTGAVSGFLWGGMVRLFLGSHLTWSINSICHMFGRRDHNTDENSRNVTWLAIPTFGESWHNGHHAYPFSARFGQKWWQLDSGYLTIRLMTCLGLANNVNVAPPERKRRAGPNDERGHDEHSR
jgi:stearoyl-CoA desaturase (Delta-9 desaturase)